MAEAHNLTHNLTSLSVSRDGPPPGPRAPGVRDAGHPQRAHATRHGTGAPPRPRRHGNPETPRTELTNTTVHAQCVLTHPECRENYQRFRYDKTLIIVY